MPEHELIANAGLVESSPELLALVVRFKASIEYEMKKCRVNGDDEGANLKAVVLREVNAVIDKARGGLYWTFELDGEIYDGDFDSRDEADNHAQEKYAEECCEESPRNGEEFERDDYALILFRIDDDGERVIYNREDAVLEYEHYHGDEKEHGYP